MKKILLLSVVAMSTAMFASSSVDYTGRGGTLSGSRVGLSHSRSVLIAANLIAARGLNGGGLLTGSGLEGLRSTTGTLTGSLKMGVTFAGETSSKVAVAEPGSLSLLGTALIGLAGLVRHKLKK